MELNVLKDKARKIAGLDNKGLDFDLTISEIELILRLVGQTTFPVKDIEPLYIALYKLQMQHTKLIGIQKQIA